MPSPAKKPSKSKCYVADDGGKKVGLFDLINDLSYTKQDLLHDVDGSVKHAVLKAYVPFMVNRTFSLHLSSIMDAAIMNMAGDLIPAMQHDYYLHVLPRAKRFSGKWAKTITGADVLLLAKEYGVGISEAKEMAMTLLPDQIKHIRAKWEQVGGTRK